MSAPNAARGGVSNVEMRAFGAIVRGALAVLAMLAAGCPKPTDGTPDIPVSPGLAQRLALMPGRPPPGLAASASASASAPSPAGVAHAHVLAPGRELGGANATAKAASGDWILENDEVAFVIHDGDLVDAADAKTREDELGSLAASFEAAGASLGRAVYTKVDGYDHDGDATVVAEGRVSGDGAIAVRTSYKLAGPDRALLVTTTIRNGATDARRDVRAGDAVDWGSARFVGDASRSSSAFLGAVGARVSYAVTTPDGVIAATTTAGKSETHLALAQRLDPGAELSFDRVFVVGQRGDTASVVAELTRAAGGEVGLVVVTLKDDKGNEVAVPAGAKVTLATPALAGAGAGAGAQALSIVADHVGARFGGEVPPGRWLVAYKPSGGMHGDGTTAEVVVRKDAPARVALSVRPD